MLHYPSIPDIQFQLLNLKSRIIQTPIHLWNTPLKNRLLGKDTFPVFKLELLQVTGTFKIRGVFTAIDQMSDEQKSNGIVVGTGGNHGIAVAYAAKAADIHAKVLVPRTINAMRRKMIEDLGATIVELDSINMILEEMEELAQRENRTIIHPFNDPAMIIGSGTLGYELLQQAPNLDAVIVPIGGGGLAAGLSCAIKQLNPNCKIYGVEPIGAASMAASFKTGKAERIEGGPKSIADSLCSPKTEEYSLSICKDFVDKIVTVTDDQIRSAMRILFEDVKLAVEPAGATAMSALLGPLKAELYEKKIGVIVCGSNINCESFHEILNSK